MDINQATLVFDALSQETRLTAFRLLVQAGPSGLAAGALSEQLAVPHNTLSFHLKHLANAGVVEARKDGRSVIYSANYLAMRELIEFLVKDCCGSDVAKFEENQQSGCAVIELKDCCDTNR